MNNAGLFCVGILAQLVELAALNGKVDGSNPSSPIHSGVYVNGRQGAF